MSSPRRSSQDPKSPPRLPGGWSFSGQVAVEYLLLFSLGLALALLISSQMVSRNTDEPGFLIAKWQALKEWIGKDDPGKRSDSPQR